MEEFKPGQVISPQGDTPASDQAPVTVPQPAPPQPQRPTEQIPDVPAPSQGNEPPAQAAASAQPAVQAEQPADTADGWQFRHESDVAGASVATEVDAPLPDEITWIAGEFTAHEKTAGWYGLLALGGVLGAALIFWLTRDKITTGIVIFAVLSFGLLAARKPKEQTYAVDHVGLHVGNHSYSMQSFRSFSVTEDGQAASIVLMPLKRFMPQLTIYLAPDSEESVVDFLAQFLPFEQHRQDAVDSLMRRIRF